MDEFRRTLSKSLGMVFLLTLPSSVGLVVLGKSIIGAIYQGGKFSLYDTQQTALALSCYAIGLAGYAALKVLNPAFYALGDARTPMLVSLASIVINYAAAGTMIRVAGLRPRGAGALDFRRGAVRLRGAVRDSARPHRRHSRTRAGGAAREGRRGFAGHGRRGVRFPAASWRSMLGVSQLARLADLAVSIPLGLAVYLRGLPRAGRERHRYGRARLHGADPSQAGAIRPPHRDASRQKWGSSATCHFQAFTTRSRATFRAATRGIGPSVPSKPSPQLSPDFLGDDVAHALCVPRRHSWRRSDTERCVTARRSVENSLSLDTAGASAAPVGACATSSGGL